MKQHKKWITQQRCLDFIILSDLIVNVETEAHRLNADWHVNKHHTRITLESDSFITTLIVKRLSVGMSVYYKVEKAYHYEGGEVL